MFGGLAHWLLSLRVKLILILIPIVIASMLLAMMGLDQFLHGFFQRRAELETEQLGQAVKAALRQSMLKRPELAFNDTLADVQKNPSIRRVWIIDKSGRIAHASDHPMVGKLLDKQQHPTCTVCHSGPATPDSRTFFTRDETGVPIIRHISRIENDAACWECHDSKTRLNGVLLLEESTATFETALWTVQRRLAGTGAITLVVLVTAIFLVTTMLVDRPVRRLMAGVRQLATGDLAVRIPVRGRDELAELAASFNDMAGDLSSSIEEVQNKKAELSVVYSILERVTKTIDLGELKEIMLQTMIDVLGADKVLLATDLPGHRSREILIRTCTTTRVHRIAHTGSEAELMGEGLPSEVVRCWANGELQGPSITPDRQTAIIPVQMREAKLGLLIVFRKRPFRHSEANPELLRALAHHIGVAFENAHLYTLAITDELTQLCTVRHFQNRIGECISRYQRYKQKFSVLMLDLDHFKNINDAYGHPAGDEILRGVAHAVLGTIRAVDSAYRYGGDEFAVLLPETNSATARLVADRVCQRINGLQLSLAAGKIPVTASIGLAVCPEDGDSADKLIAAADAALYAAKQEGRNRVSGGSTPEPRALLLGP